MQEIGISLNIYYKDVQDSQPFWAYSFYSIFFFNLVINTVIKYQFITPLQKFILLKLNPM